MGVAVQDGKITAREAVDFIENIVQHGLGTPAGWRHTLKGMAGQVRRGETSAGEVLKFLAASAARRTYAYRGGLLSRAFGTKVGKPAVSSRRMLMAEGRGFNNMGGVTGTACAAFAVLALDEAGQRTGSFAPEDWADPEAFYTAVERVGIPRGEIVESLSQYL